MNHHLLRTLPYFCLASLILNPVVALAEDYSRSSYLPLQSQYQLPPNMNGAVMQVGKTTATPGEPILVYTNYSSDTGQGKVHLVPAHIAHGNQALADNDTLEWHYAESNNETRPQMTLTFQAPERPGTYEFRLYNEGAEIQTIGITVGDRGPISNNMPLNPYVNVSYPQHPESNNLTNSQSTAPLPSYNANKPYVGQTSLKLDRDVYQAGETIHLRYTTDSRADSANALVKLVPSVAPHGSARINDAHAMEWHYTQESQGILSFTAPNRPGTYELRFFLDDPEIMATSFTVQ